MIREGNNGFFILKKDTIVNRITISKKVELSLKDQGRSKTWLAKQFMWQRAKLYKRLDDNFWEPEDIVKLKDLGLA